jgi:DNA-binding response OmpR family regulator
MMGELGWPVCRTQCVLVVDDDSLIRAIIQRALRRAGYGVLIAEDGASALACFQGCAGVIDLILTDIMMPGIHGDELVARIRASTAAPPVIYMSGRSRSELIRERRLTASDVYLQKPFSRVGLLREVQAQLGSLLPPPAAAQRAPASSAMPSARNK